MSPDIRLVIPKRPKPQGDRSDVGPGYVDRESPEVLFPRMNFGFKVSPCP
jgi:hypothetical protein